MENKLSAFEQRLKDNIRNYTLSMLLGMNTVKMYLNSFAETLGMEVLLTDRKGVEVACAGDFTIRDIDMEKNPGRTLIIQGRKMGHLYVRRTESATESECTLSMEEEAFVDATTRMLEKLALQTYLQKEAMLYIEQNDNAENPGTRMYNLEKEDGLTGVFNKNYFENRLKIIERAEIVPVAVIVANINDWKFVNDNYGDDESDRLIQIIGGILRSEAKEEYVIGRVDGDVFHILIPLTEDNEAEEYAKVVQRKCEEFEDARLAPSVAIGIQYKTNIEEKISDKLSDAEYEMFENKLEMKNASGYTERLKHGL